MCVHTPHVCMCVHIRTCKHSHLYIRARGLPSQACFSTLSLFLSDSPLLTSSEGSPTGVEVERLLSYHLLHIFLLCNSP